MGADLHFNPPHESYMASWDGSVLLVWHQIQGQQANPVDALRYDNPNDDLIRLLEQVGIKVPPKPGTADVTIHRKDGSRIGGFAAPVSVSYDKHYTRLVIQLPATARIGNPGSVVTVKYEFEILQQGSA